MALFSAAQIYALARRAGFPPDSAVEMTAIALRESSGYTTAHNPKPPDDSFGLWQINMIGKLAPYRIQLFGLSRKEDLYDPVINSAAAFRIWTMAGGNPSKDWHEVPQEFMPDAINAQITNGEGPYGSGDPGQNPEDLTGGNTGPSPVVQPVGTSIPISQALQNVLNAGSFTDAASQVTPGLAVAGAAVLLGLILIAGHRQE